MFYLTPQERKFIAVVMIVFIVGTAIQFLGRRNATAVRWVHSVRPFKININTSPAEELQMLPGIGPTLAGRIVDYRNQKGPFESLEDLRNVRGVTVKRIERIKDGVEL